MYDNNMGGLNRSPVHIDLNAINWANPYAVKICPNPGCLIVRTTCAIHKLDPDKKRTYFVSVRDGEREANFITDGSDHLSTEHFTDGITFNGVRFFGYKRDINNIYVPGMRRNPKAFKIARSDMKDFIMECLQIPVRFVSEGSDTYTVNMEG